MAVRVVSNSCKEVVLIESNSCEIVVQNRDELKQK